MTEESKFFNLSFDSENINEILISLKDKIERPDKTIYPAETLDSQNPLPYVFKDVDELKWYIKRAKNETFSSLFMKVKNTITKYVNAKNHYISILAADIIHSFFYDRFSTVHYNIFLGDNGSGKNSALLVFRFLGYRVFYVTAASASNYYTFLSDVEEGQRLYC